jgi:hypothetical protein
MTDPIRAALAKAAFEMNPDGFRAYPTARRNEAAAAIAAFLRALPDLSVCPRLTCNYNGSGDSSATLAEAVLAAAKDQTNE